MTYVERQGRVTHEEGATGQPGQDVLVRVRVLVHLCVSLPHQGLYLAAFAKRYSDRKFRGYTRPDLATTGGSENWSLGLPRFCCQVLVLVERSTDTSSLLIEHIAVHGPVSPSECGHK